MNAENARLAGGLPTVPLVSGTTVTTVVATTSIPATPQIPAKVRRTRCVVNNQSNLAVCYVFFGDSGASAARADEIPPGGAAPYYGPDALSIWLASGSGSVKVLEELP